MDAVTILKLCMPCSVRSAGQFPTASRFVCGPIEVRYQVGDTCLGLCELLTLASSKPRAFTFQRSGHRADLLQVAVKRI